MEDINFEGFCKKPKGSKSNYTVDCSLDDYFSYYSDTVNYDSFSSKFANTSTGLIIKDKKLYKQIIRDMFILMGEKLLSSPEYLKIPGIGSFRVEKNKMGFKALAAKKKLRINYKDSKLANKIVYHLNEHTNGYYYSIRWAKTVKSNKLLFFYNFRAQQKIKRALSKQIQNSQYTDFYINDSHKTHIQ